jgi:hypothetical protein
MKRNLTSCLFFIGLLALSTFLYRCKKPGLTPAGSLSPASLNAQVKAAAAAPQITSFVHPAVLNTQASLQFAANQVNGGDAGRLASYQKVLDFINGHDYPTSFPSRVVVGSNGVTTPSKDQIRKDAELVYALALRWTKTGDLTYANQAIGILNGWAYNFTGYDLVPNAGTNASQPDLEASWTTPSFVAAAEIIRYYKVNGAGSGWSQADIQKFSDFLNLVKNNYINNIPDYGNNWDASAGYAKMAIGIFLNSATVYQNGYNFILQYLPVIISPDGTIGEYCDRKDCVHFQYSLTAFAYAAGLARLQGDNGIWNALGNRISAGYDYQWKAYNNGASCSYCSTSSPVFPGVEVAYNFYKTANLQHLRELQDPLGVPNDNTFLGFTSYTHFNVPGL